MPVPSSENVVDLVVAEIETMASVCRGVDPATPVPSCPGWDLAQLLSHTGTVHRWAATMVERVSATRLGRDDLELDRPDDDTALADWLGAGADFVAGRFRDADPAAAMWAWGWPKTAGFWPRRMLHETGIHRADAQLAVGASPAYDPEVAADGIDELLDNLPHAVYFAPAVAQLKGDGETLVFGAPDLDDGWTIRLGPDGFSWARDAGAGEGATATLRASASDLLLSLYGRRPVGAGEIRGDGALVERWITNSSL